MKEVPRYRYPIFLWSVVVMYSTMMLPLRATWLPPVAAAACPGGRVCVGRPSVDVIAVLFPSLARAALRAALTGVPVHTGVLRSDRARAVVLVVLLADRADVALGAELRDVRLVVRERDDLHVEE